MVTIDCRAMGCCGETTAQMGPHWKLWRLSSGLPMGPKATAISASPLAISLSISCILPTLISTNTFGHDCENVLITDSIKVVTNPPPILTEMVPPRIWRKSFR
ncbi:Uncharacterised protein [Klebsiella aerogenes]|nr:Uncharacterised protein [Klebsiella aerogenes]